VAGGASNFPGQTVTRSNMLNNLIMNLSGGTSNAGMLNAIRISRIRVYSCNTSATNSATVTLEWLSTYGPSKYISDTALGMTSVAMIDSKPPRTSLASAWSLSGSNESDVLFSISCPSSSIIDVTVQLIVMDGSNARIATTSASGTTGFVYATPLDGPRSGANFGALGLPSLN
jgi:hypothetical protein